MIPRDRNNYTDWIDRESRDWGDQTKQEQRGRFEEYEPLKEAPVTDLWGGMRIPIVMVSGSVNSGKTLFGLTIDPNCRRPAADVEPTTLVYDQEGSSDSYVGALNFSHKDTRAAVAAGVHNQIVAPASDDPRWLRILKQQADCNDSPSAALFRAWYLSLIQVPAGKFRVGVVDTFTPLQEGLIDWLKRHPEAFGRTANEYGKASSMFLWPDVKAMLSHILSTDCRLRFETFVLTVHLKSEWVGGQKTSNKIAEGLDTLEKLATVHFELDRTPKAKGKDAPRVPAGILKKERLVRFGLTAADDQPILPPRLPECTPDAIRAYILAPPDFSKLTAGERLPEPEPMTEEQRLSIQQTTAQANAEAAQANLSALELARAAAQQGIQAGAQQAAAAMASHAVAAVAEVSPVMQAQQEPTPPAKPEPLQIKPHQQAEMIGLLRELFATGVAAQEWLFAEAGTNNPADMLETQAMGVLSKLLAMKHERTIPTPPAPAPPESVPQPQDNRATQGQRDEIRQLTFRLYGDTDGTAEQAKWLQSLGYSSAQSLTSMQAADRLAVLRGLLNPLPVEDDIPF